MFLEPNMDYQLRDGRVVTVREFKREDFASMLVMFQSLSKEALQFGRPPYDQPRLERWVSGLEGGILLLALDRANVVGVSMIFGRALARLKGVGELVIYIHQGYHGQGLGSFLTRTILLEAKRRGFHRVGLEVVADNVAAIKMYERAGFLREGRLKDAFFGDDGKYHDELVMGILL
jgi:RimJ/RimL family protein N-acetyltransferase